MRRVKESELLIPTLRVLSGRPNGFATTSELIDELMDQFQPRGVDADLLSGRNDTHFSQKVRNLVSHRHNSNGLEKRGWASYDGVREGWTITELGRRFISQR